MDGLDIDDIDITNDPSKDHQLETPKLQNDHIESENWILNDLHGIAAPMVLHIHAGCKKGTGPVSIFSSSSRYIFS